MVILNVIFIADNKYYVGLFVESIDVQHSAIIPRGRVSVDVVEVASVDDPGFCRSGR
jgi:hypothetical protein